MNSDQVAAHQRLAALPTLRHRRTEVDRSEVARQSAEKGARTKRERGGQRAGAAVVLEGSRPRRKGKA